MNVNIMNLLVAKTIAENEGVPADRAFQLGLVASMMPPTTGMLVSLMIARREAPTASPTPTPAPPPESMQELYARAKAEYARLSAETEAVVDAAHEKLASAKGTKAEQVLQHLVKELLTLQKNHLPTLDPDQLPGPIDRLVAQLTMVLLTQAEYARALTALRDQVDAVVVERVPEK